MEEIRIPQGDIIYREGDPGDAIFVIEEGEVAVSRQVEDRLVRLAVLGKGEIFGESGVIQDKPRSTTMTALSDVAALKLDKEHFLQAFGEDNPIGLPLLRMLCARLAKADDRMLATKAETRNKATVAELSSIRILPASDFIAKQIGDDGAPVKDLPFRVGRRIMHDKSPSVLPNALSLHGTNDNSLSPEHFAIERREGGIIVRDLGSYLGTIAHGRHLSRFSHSATAPLYFGVNEIIAGTKESPYRFRIVAEPKETRPQPQARKAGP